MLAVECWMVGSVEALETQQSLFYEKPGCGR